MRRAVVIALVVGVTAAFLGGSAQAITKTVTKGDVSDRSMEQFGGYTFKGSTRPSEGGR